jgi:hypothetical protein
MILDDRQMIFHGPLHRDACHDTMRLGSKIDRTTPNHIRERYYRSMANLIPPDLRLEIVDWLFEREIEYEIILAEIVFHNPNDEMEFKLRLDHAQATLDGFPVTTPDVGNVILTIMLTGMRTSPDSLLKSEINSLGTSTILNKDIAAWLKERNIPYWLGKMEITIPDDDQAMEFKLRWL